MSMNRLPNQIKKNPRPQMQSWLEVLVASIERNGNGSLLSSKRFSRALLVNGLVALTVALVALVPEAAATYHMSQSPSSLSRADAVSGASKQGLLASSALEQNRAQAALFAKPKLQSMGQKETEQLMNPNEVLTDNVALLEPFADLEQSFSLEAEDLDKRAQWNSLQGGWGKRAANNWNKLSAAWGKRRLPNEANGWNNLSGMWGKKRAKWNELSGMWGKRAWKDMSGGWGKKKRSGSSPHWNKLRGMWGKRSAMAPLAPNQSTQ